jgi:hypothetical protein
MPGSSEFLFQLVGEKGIYKLSGQENLKRTLGGRGVVLDLHVPDRVPGYRAMFGRTGMLEQKRDGW